MILNNWINLKHNLNNLLEIYDIVIDSSNHDKIDLPLTSKVHQPWVLVRKSVREQRRVQ